MTLNDWIKTQPYGECRRLSRIAWASTAPKSRTGKKEHARSQ